MLPVAPVYSAPILSPLSAPAVANVSAVSAMELPATSVSTAIASQPSYNNTKSATSASPSILETGTTAPSSPSGFSTLLSMPETSPAVRFSSPFLAQLMSQATPASAASIAQFYANDNGASTLDSRLMEIFSMVKYKPSFASQPMPQPSGTAALMPNQVEMPVKVPEPAVYSNPVVAVFQRAAQSRAAAIQGANITATAVLPRAAVNDNKEVAAPANDLPARRFTSLVRESGISAYQASTARNEANLAPQKTESTDNL